jgi:hypothetical protein
MCPWMACTTRETSPFSTPRSILFILFFKKTKWQACDERYRLADTVAELTFVFIRVIFLGSPAFRSSLVLTKVTDSVDSARPIPYSTFHVSPPFLPCPQPSRSFMYTGTSVLVTQPVRLWLPLRNWRLYVCTTTEMVFLSAQLPRRPPPRSRIYTGTSVLVTQPGRWWLPLWNWRI